MAQRAIFFALCFFTNLATAESGLVCPTEKIHEEQDIVSFCDSLRIRHNDDFIYALIRVNDIAQSSTENSPDPQEYKKNSFYLLSKYEIFEMSNTYGLPYTRILATDSTYLKLRSSVVMTKETAIMLSQEGCVQYISLMSVPHIPEGPPRWPTGLIKRARAKQTVKKMSEGNIDIQGRNIRTRHFSIVVEKQRINKNN